MPSKNVLYRRPPYRRVGRCVTLSCPPKGGHLQGTAGHPSLRGFKRAMCLFLKKGSDKIGFGKDGKGAIIREDLTHTLGTLGTKTGILITAGGSSGNLGEDFRILKTEGQSNANQVTAGNPAVSLYMVNGELTLAECEEAIELSGPDDRNDRLDVERSERFVRLIGVYVPAGIGTTAHIRGTGMFSYNPRWTFSNPAGWDYMVYNNGPVNLDTGQIITTKLTHFGVWVT